MKTLSVFTVAILSILINNLLETQPQLYRGQLLGGSSQLVGG